MLCGHVTLKRFCFTSLIEIEIEIDSLLKYRTWQSVD